MKEVLKQVPKAGLKGCNLEVGPWRGPKTSMFSYVMDVNSHQSNMCDQADENKEILGGVRIYGARSTIYIQVVTMSHNPPCPPVALPSQGKPYNLHLKGCSGPLWVTFF